ncbi:MAG: VTT domain-containing protein [Acidobacteriia bacterium]|nr:VTT domain-containing protein [Terriglobia bacterium]
MEQLLELISRYGVLFVFVNVLIEQAGLPVPALPTLVLAGALAADGKLSAPWALVAALLASTIADSAWYLIGRRLGHRVLRTVCRLSISPESCVRQTEGVFERYGLVSLVLAKFIPGYSTLAPPLAGIVGTRAAAFLAYNTAGSLLWAGLPLLGGMLLHHMVDRVIGVLEGLGTWGLAVLAGGLVVYLLARWARLSRFRRALRIARISAEELQRMMDAGHQPLILDVRTNLVFALDPRTIPGAVRFHIDELDSKLADVPREKEIVLFCT